MGPICHCLFLFSIASLHPYLLSLSPSFHCRRHTVLDLLDLLRRTGSRPRRQHGRPHQQHSRRRRSTTGGRRVQRRCGEGRRETEEGSEARGAPRRSGWHPQNRWRRGPNSWRQPAAFWVCGRHRRSRFGLGWVRGSQRTRGVVAETLGMAAGGGWRAQPSQARRVGPETSCNRAVYFLHELFLVYGMARPFRTFGEERENRKFSKNYRDWEPFRESVGAVSFNL